MVVVYDKTNLDIVRTLDESQDYNVFFTHYSQSFRDNLGIIYIDNAPTKLWEYKVESGQLVKKSAQAISEIKRYGEVLNDEERVDILLSPTQQEIQQAKTTIEMLSLLQEVNAI